MKILLFLSSYLVPVQFTEVPQNITLNTSAPLFLSCDASGFPEPKIRWEKSGTTLSHTKQLNISSSNRNVAGEYACIASNGVRQEKTARAYVTVQCKSFLQYFIKSCHCYWIHDTVKPILSGLPVFSGQFSKSQIFFSLIDVILIRKEKLCLLSNCNILENGCIYIYMYKFTKTYSKKKQTQSQYPRKYPFKIENLPKLLGGMLQSNL